MASLSAAKSQNSAFKPGYIDSLNKKQGYFPLYLNHQLVHCDSTEQPSYTYFTYYLNGKVESLYKFPRFSEDFELQETEMTEQSDSIITLNDTLTFKTKKGIQYQFIYKNGYLVSEHRRYPGNRPTVYIPSFKVEDNIIVDMEDYYFDKKYKDYELSFYYEYTSEEKVISRYLYHNGKKWKRTKREVEKVITP